QTYVFTGLRHMSGNEGNIYRIERAPNEIPRAVLVAELNGAPQAIDKSGTGVAFSTSVFHGRGEHGMPLFRTVCYKFSPPSRVNEVPCATGVPPNNSFKPKPLRGSA